jgi:prepilin-type N-terminal cleavage/methylation domain-containing protein
MKTKKAFTLVEVLVVLAILALLAMLLVPAFMQARKLAQGLTNDEMTKFNHNTFRVTELVPPPNIHRWKLIELDRDGKTYCFLSNDTSIVKVSETAPK